MTSVEPVDLSALLLESTDVFQLAHAKPSGFICNGFGVRIHIWQYLSMKRLNKSLSADRSKRAAESVKHLQSPASLEQQLKGNKLLLPGLYVAVRFEAKFELGKVRRIGTLKNNGRLVDTSQGQVTCGSQTGFYVQFRWLYKIPESRLVDGVVLPVYETGDYHDDPGVSLAFLVCPLLSYRSYGCV